MLREHREFIDYIRNCFNRTHFRFLFSGEVITFIACQFALESRFGQSSKAVKDHNLCGMRHSNRRPSFQDYANHNGFAVFCDDETCVFDYIARTLYFQPHYDELFTVVGFCSFLVRSKYCVFDPDYISKIQKIFSDYGKD